MLIDVNQWRAAIGMFRSNVVTNMRAAQHNVSLFSVLIPILKSYLFCIFFVLIAIPLLPLTLTIQSLAILFYPKSCFLHNFARLYLFTKTTFYIASKLMKRASYGLLNLPKCKRVRKKVFTYVYLNTVCLTCHTLCVQWLTYRSTLLSGDVEMNPGPSHECLSFCSWNLNSICAHDFLRVSLIEAYNTVYNYDLIGIVETHLDNTVDETKLAIDGYSFYKSNHPQNGKQGGVGLYVKESFPARERNDLKTLSECIVCEIQIKGKKYFFTVLYRSPSQSQEELEVFINKFELMLSKMASENPYCVVITQCPFCPVVGERH